MPFCGYVFTINSARFLSALLSLVMLLLACGCREAPPPDSHERMLRTLDRIAERAADENIYIGDFQIDQLRAALATMPPIGREVDRFRVIWQIGYHQARLGNMEDAIKEFQAAYALLPNVAPQLSTSDVETFLVHIAATHLRKGECENCIECHEPESCILPIQGGGVHSREAGALQSIEFIEELLEQNPKNLAGRWLLNIAKMALGEYPDGVPKEFRIPPEQFQDETDFPRFVDVAPDLGLNAITSLGGAIVDDFDDDGFLDVVTSSWNPTVELNSFVNNGDGTFTQNDQAAGLTRIRGGLNMVQADYDNDGDVDIFIVRGAWLGKMGRHPNSLLQNDGQGRFRDVTFEAGLGERHFPAQSSSWADYDNDGDLDLYVGNERYPSQLFENDGNGHFREVALRAGVSNVGFVKGVIWGDYDGDRFPDLYVSNYGEANRLYHNNGDGTFTDVASACGVAGPTMSFTVWFFDFNNDGVLDLYVATYFAGIEHVAAQFFDEPHNAELAKLYQGDGQGGFRDVTEAQNLTRVAQTMGANFGDLDNDGYQDFYLGTGYPEYEALMPNVMYHNQGGTGFTDITTAGGFGHLQKGHGVAFADMDNDGDRDVFQEIGGAFPGDAFGNALFENPGFGRHSITIKLIGNSTNRSAIGARIRADIIDQGEARSVYKWVNSGGCFGGSPLRQQIGLGSAQQIETLEIYWPTSDTTQKFENVAAGQFIEILEGVDEYRTRPLRKISFHRPAQATQNEKQ